MHVGINLSKAFEKGFINYWKNKNKKPIELPSTNIRQMLKDKNH